MKNKKILLFVMVISVICSFLAGCSNNGGSKADYQVYYKNLYDNGLMSEGFDTKETDAYNLAGLLLKELQKPESDKMVSVFPEKFTVESYNINERVLYLYFEDGFYNLDNATKVLIKAAVVKTMVQIKDIDYVTFYVGNKPLTDSNGIVAGLQSDKDYVDDSQENSVGVTDCTIYYSDQTGKTLVGEKITLVYSNTVSAEQAVLDRMISGPEYKDLKRTLPQNIKVLNVSTKDGICYVNFNTAFFDSIVDVSAQVVIYSIVDSLSELNNVKKVQILVDGNAGKVFREEIPLNVPFERNLDLISEKRFSK